MNAPSAGATVLYEARGPVALLTLNRPEALNSFTRQMHRDLWAALDVAEADPAIRAAVITGAGRGFCAGADISSGAGAFDSKAEGSVAFKDAGSSGRRGGGAGFVGAMFNCRKPIIAAINGAAFAGGLTGDASFSPIDILLLALLPLLLTAIATWVARQTVLRALREAL